MRILCLTLMITSTLGASPALAQSEADTLDETYLPETEEIMPATEVPVPQEADTQSRLWLRLQESGAMAGSRYTLPGQAATLVYQRYLNSFSHPIPAEFKSDDSNGGGSSASSGRR